MLSSKIMEFAAQSPEGTIFGAKELLHLGPRNAVDQALRRLAQRKKLLRVGRGMYAAPIESRWGIRGPSPHEIVQAHARKWNAKIARTPVATASALGLTLQVPVQEIWLTSRKSCQIYVGKLPITFRHAPGYLLHEGMPGHVVRALAWAREDLAVETLTKLEEHLSPSDREVLLGLRGSLPSWMARVVSSLDQASAG